MRTFINEWFTYLLYNNVWKCLLMTNFSLYSLEVTGKQDTSPREEVSWWAATPVTLWPLTSRRCVVTEVATPERFLFLLQWEQVLQKGWPLEENERAVWLFTGVECATCASLLRGEGRHCQHRTTQLNNPNNHILPAYNWLHIAWATGLNIYYLSIYWMYTCASVWIWSILDSVTCPCSLLPLTDKLLSPGKR